MSCKRTCKYYKTGSTVPGKRNTKRAQQARKKKKDYRVEYNKTEEATKKRSELVRLNREYQKKGLGKVGDGKDVSHKPGGKTTLESASKNRGGKSMPGDKKARGRKKMQEGGYVLKKTNDSIFKKQGGKVNKFFDKRYGSIFEDDKCVPCQQKKMQQGGIAPPPYNALGLLLSGLGGNKDEDMNARRDIIELQDTTTMGVGTSKDIFPIYEDLNDFYEINKDRTVILPDKNQVLGLEGGKFEETPLFDKGSTTHYCYPYSDNPNCMVRANTLVNALIPGNNYYKSSDETLKDIGVTYTTQHKPTEEEKAKYPYMEFDENFGSLDSWDITYQMHEFSPKNVLFDAMNGNRTLPLEEMKNNSLSINDIMRDYKDQIQVGSYITLGTMYGSDGRQVLGGSHTVRVVGFKPNGMPIVADHGAVKELADAMYINGDLDAKTIRSILGVPGKEKYTFGYFDNKRQNMEIPSNERYIKDHNNLPSYPRSLNTRENVKASENFVRFEKTLGENKNYITSVLDISPAEYDEYAKIALAISGSETEYGTANVYKYLRDFKKSEGVSQLRMENVENLYPKILSKYKKGSEEYNSLATLLYVNEINKYRKKWMKQGSRAQERPYTKDNFGATDAVRRLGQGRTKQGYVGRIFQDVFRSEGESVDIPNRRLFEGKDRYKNRVNTELQKVSGELADKLRFDFDEDGNRVIFKKTPGNTIPNTLRDVAFYAWQTPSTVIYGDAAGDSTYYKKNKKIYDELFE